jgi:FeS assembly SUF system protein
VGIPTLLSFWDLAMNIESQSPPQEETRSTAAAAPASDLEAKVAEAERIQDLQERIVAALKTCFDPEIPVNIHELGLIYAVDVSPENLVKIKMTLTSPACPVAGTLPGDVQAKVKSVAGVKDAQVEVVWDPILGPERMSEAARLQLGFDLF